MGHVSRCIGLIYKLKKQGNWVVVACSDSQRKVFEEYFDDLVYEDHAPYPFKFGGRGWFSFDLAKRFVHLKRRRKQELVEVERLVEKHSIDVVIADHRYGFRSEKTYSIFVTHQLKLPVLWFEASILRVHKRLIRKFDRVWVMDFADSRLAGELSRNTPLFAADYIGPYSRFQLYTSGVEKFDFRVLIASGPKIYAQQLIDEVYNSGSRSCMIVVAGEGLNTHDMPVTHGWRAQDQQILAADRIISRSGYSTIMDLHYLGTQAKLIPTPGQREQEYLAALYNAKRSAE